MSQGPVADAADRSWLEALSAAIYVVDPSGTLTYFNAAAVALWGSIPSPDARWNGFERLFLVTGEPVSSDEDPAARAVKSGSPLRDIEMLGERRDGSRIRFLSSPSPLRDAAGAPAGAINLLIDVSARAQAEADSERLAAIVASSEDVIISKTLEGRITSWNRGATNIFGYQEAEMIGEPITKLIPPELHAEEEGVLQRLRNGERIDHFETTRVTKDGRRIDVSLTVSPLRDKTGKVVGASKVARDITQRKQAEKTQALLLGELSHRVKNTLATVQAIATQSLRRSRDPQEFVDSFSGRIQSLSRSHDLLSETRWEGMALGALVREQVLLGTGDNRIAYNGPDVALKPQSGLHLALVLHELGTNARKYGALSVPDGRLTLDWRVVATASGSELRMNWVEEGGPRPVTPSSRGFGTTLIEGGLSPHGGTAVIEFGAGGVSCALTLPLGRAAAPQAAAPSPVRPGDPALQGKRVLVVEDEPIIAMEIVSILEEIGCSVAGPTGAVETALRLVESGCDGALLDANLSNEPVGELAAALTRAGIPFAFVSGYEVDALPQSFRNTVLLAKPFTRAQLVATVKTLLLTPDAPAATGVVRINRPAR